MAITVELPTVLQSYAGGDRVLEVEHPCSTVREVLDAIGTQYPGVVDRVVTERGEVRRHVNVFVDDESIRQKSGLDTPVGEGSSIYILAAVSGG